MKYFAEMIVLAVIITFAILTVAHAQDIYPDSPSTAQPPARTTGWQSFKHSWHTQWDPNVPMASTWAPFKSPSFVISAVALHGAVITDVLISQHDFRNGCVEGTGDARRRPSMLEQMTENEGLAWFVTGGSYFLKRKHIKVLPEAFMLVGAGRHTYGIVKGLQSPCY